MITANNQEDRIITIRQNGYSIREKVKGKIELPHSQIIILVHGYNVSEEGAKEAYKKFQENLSKYCSQLSQLEKEIYWFLWPSDKPNKIDSVISYYKTVETAKICGEKFAKYLNKLKLKSLNNKPPHIILIGHSLGCRLLLEALKNTNKNNKKYYKIFFNKFI